ncbi:MAG: hypothetical protein AAGE01_13935 [Pseudomonadota bacterium]
MKPYVLFHMSDGAPVGAELVHWDEGRGTITVRGAGSRPFQGRNFRSAFPINAEQWAALDHRLYGREIDRDDERNITRRESAARVAHRMAHAVASAAEYFWDSDPSLYLDLKETEIAVTKLGEYPEVQRVFAPDRGRAKPRTSVHWLAKVHRTVAWCHLQGAPLSPVAGRGSAFAKARAVLKAEADAAREDGDPPPKIPLVRSLAEHYRVMHDRVVSTWLQWLMVQGGLGSLLGGDEEGPL